VVVVVVAAVVVVVVVVVVLVVVVVVAAAAAAEAAPAPAATTGAAEAPAAATPTAAPPAAATAEPTQLAVRETAASRRPALSTVQSPPPSVLAVPDYDAVLTTSWDSLVEMLANRLVPGLRAGTRDPQQNLNWILVGFDVSSQTYPPGTQLFDGGAFWPQAVVEEAKKCKYSLAQVVHLTQEVRATMFVLPALPRSPEFQSPPCPPIPSAVCRPSPPRPLFWSITFQALAHARWLAAALVHCPLDPLWSWRPLKSSLLCTHTCRSLRRAVSYTARCWVGPW